MAEIQKIGHWFFASDRVMTICAHKDSTEGLFVFATPLPCITSDDSVFDLAGLEEQLYPIDMEYNCVKVALDGEHIVCDIPDNYALFVCDSESGEPADRADEEIVIYWSKR